MDKELCAFTAYSDARQEINILSHIQHTNVVSLFGVLLQPLSLVLAFAPQGSLQGTVDAYSASGCKLSLICIQQILVQISQALSYLHTENIIFRDLKADNVLVWSLPAPHSSQAVQIVDVKLADFGVSRTGQSFQSYCNFSRRQQTSPLSVCLSVSSPRPVGCQRQRRYPRLHGSGNH